MLGWTQGVCLCLCVCVCVCDSQISWNQIIWEPHLRRRVPSSQLTFIHSFIHSFLHSVIHSFISFYSDHLLATTRKDSEKIAVDICIWNTKGISFWEGSGFFPGIFFFKFTWVTFFIRDMSLKFTKIFTRKCENTQAEIPCKDLKNFLEEFLKLKWQSLRFFSN